MQLHANAALGLAGRRRLVGLIEQGHSLRAAAAALSVAPATAHRWWHRWAAAEPAGAPLGRLPGRSLEPPASLAAAPVAAQEAPILAARAQTNLGPGRLAHLVPAGPLDDLEGPGPPRRLAPAPAARGRSGAATSGPGRAPYPHRHRPPGALWPARAPHPRTGRVDVHANAGDGLDLRPRGRRRHEPLRLRRAARRRAGAHLRGLPGAGPGPLRRARPGARRGRHDRRRALLPHRGRLPGALARAGARHILTPPYTPRWNGKAERFIQTMKAEWAYAHEWPSSAARARALPSWVRTYNRRRLHSALGDRPPISRVHNVRG